MEYWIFDCDSYIVNSFLSAALNLVPSCLGFTDSERDIHNQHCHVENVSESLNCVALLLV